MQPVFLFGTTCQVLRDCSHITKFIPIFSFLILTRYSANNGLWTHSARYSARHHWHNVKQNIGSILKMKNRAKFRYVWTVSYLHFVSKNINLMNLMIRAPQLCQNGRSQNTVPIASTQVAIKGVVQYSTRARTYYLSSVQSEQSVARHRREHTFGASRVARRSVATSCTYVSAINTTNFIQCNRCVQT